MPRGRPKNKFVEYAEQYDLITYLGPPCNAHPHAPYCVRRKTTKHCILAHRESRDKWDQDNALRRKQRKTELAAFRADRRAKRQKALQAAQAVMATPYWQLKHRAKKLFGRRFD